MAPKRIVLAGGSGFVGQALAGRLLADGYEVIVLSRGKPRNALGTIVPWDGSTLGDWAKSLEDALAVVNLTGKNINCRLTQSNRRKIVRSRVASVEVIGEAIRRCRRPPRVFVQTAAVGIYGDTGERVCDESTPPGGDFLGETCQQWEKAFDESPMPSVRRVVLRLGVILGREGGAFPPLASLARWFLGGSVGNGRQYLSWLHLADAVRIYRDAIDREDFHGVYVATSPQPATNAQFMRELRAALHRPWSPPVPAFAVRLGGWLTGINANLALTGQRCAPRRLMQQGFAYEFPELRRALKDLTG
ncbi:MAG: TIGR01777 family oxidoreductase [Planctomycetota bacterium]